MKTLRMTDSGQRSPVISHLSSAISSKARRTTRGYSLIEVLIAIAILGTVLLSIVTLFFFGRRNVYSGKQMTQAVSIATHVMEDLSKVSAPMLYKHFGITSTSTLSDITIFGQTYDDSLIRSTRATIIPSAPSDISTSIDPDGTGAALPLLTSWTNLLGTGDTKMQEPSVTLIITPTVPNTTPLVDAAGMPVATVVRIHVIVSWSEGLRSRQVILDSVKFRRS